MSTEIKEVEVPFNHPLEEVLEIESGTTLMPTIERTTELVVHEDYDEKDKEIEDNMQEIYDAAMSAFDMQSQESEAVEGKYKARNGEVAAQFLNIALNSAKEKANLKAHKDKLNVAKAKAGRPDTVNQTMVVADRNELLKTMFGQSEEKTINPDED